MDLFLFLLGVAIVLIAAGLLIVRFFTKKPKKKLLILLAIGFILLITGPAIGVANMTPEEKAAIEEKRLAKEKEKEEAKKAKLEAEQLEQEKAEEAERLEQEKAEEAEQLEKEKEEELEREKKEETERREKEAQKEREIKEKEKEIRQKEKELKDREQKLKNEKKDQVAKEKEVVEEKETIEVSKNENREKLDAIITDLIQESDGAIKSIRPTLGDDWIAVYVTLDNSWYLLSPQEKEYLVNDMGPMLSSIIISSQVTDYSDVYFVDESGNKLASPKMLGGYKMH